MAGRSRPPATGSGGCGRKSSRNDSVSSTVLCIFQLAANSGVAVRHPAAPRVPGRWRPSTSSSEAPPPVEIQSTESAKPNFCSAATESPPPDHCVTRRGGDRLGDARVPASKGWHLEGTHRPVPEDGARPRDPLAEVGRGVAADVEAHPTLRHVHPVEPPCLGARVELSAEDEILRQLEDRVGPLGLSQHALGRLDALLLDQRVPGVASLCLEEAEAHGAADQDLLGESQEAVDDAQLVGDLRAAQDDDQRALADRRAPRVSCSTSCSSSSPA